MKSQSVLKSQTIITPKRITSGLFLILTDSKKEIVAAVSPCGVLFFENNKQVTYASREYFNAHYSIIRPLTKGEYVKIEGGDEVILDDTSGCTPF